MQKNRFVYNNKTLDNFRQQQDPAADAVVMELMESGFNLHQSESYNRLEFNQQEIPKDLPKSLIDYLEAIKSTRLDEQVIRNGQAFFKGHASEILLCLGYLSLPYCYAAANGSKVLSFSKRIYENPEKRLLETASFVFDVCSPGAFAKDGKALISIAKVRLMHAAVRYYLHKSGKWQNEWGKPVNQEDMAGTNLSFSLIVLRGMKKLGIPVNSKEWLDYILYWNEVGQLLGVNSVLLPNSSKKAYQLDYSIRKREFTYSESGAMLANSLLDYLKAQKGPVAIDSESLLYFMLGEEICSYLGFDYTKVKRLNIGPVQIFTRFKEIAKLVSGQATDYHSLIVQLNAQLQSESRFKFLTSLDR